MYYHFIVIPTSPLHMHLPVWTLFYWTPLNSSNTKRFDYYLELLCLINGKDFKVVLRWYFWGGSSLNYPNCPPSLLYLKYKLSQFFKDHFIDHFFPAVKIELKTFKKKVQNISMIFCVSIPSLCAYSFCHMHRSFLKVLSFSNV